jgi:predicted Rdx family selenoprotein
VSNGRTCRHLGIKVFEVFGGLETDHPIDINFGQEIMPVGITPITLPRIVITFCTQCRWMLRAAYVSSHFCEGAIGQTDVLMNAQFAQELLSTFGTTIGEIALAPSTGGIFKVELVRYINLLPFDSSGIIRVPSPLNHRSQMKLSGTAIFQPTNSSPDPLQTYIPQQPTFKDTDAVTSGETAVSENADDLQTQSVLLWDRKAEGGFPETKVLKQRVRDRLEPKRDLGHSDVHGKQPQKQKGNSNSENTGAKPATAESGEPAGPATGSAIVSGKIGQEQLISSSATTADSSTIVSGGSLSVQNAAGPTAEGNDSSNTDCADCQP